MSRPASRRLHRFTALVATGVLAGAVGTPPAASAAGAGSGGSGVVALPDGFGTEGVTSTRDGTFFATSLRGRGVYTGSLRTGRTESLVELPGTSLRGAVVDSHSGYVWTVGSRGSTGIVLVLDPAALDPVVEEVVLPGAGFPNDLTRTPGGMWVTDSTKDRLYRVRVAADGSAGAVVSRRLSGDWDPVADDPAGTLAANGVRRLRDGQLLVVDSRDGGLFSVDIPTGVADEVPVRGRRGLTGGDGLVLDRRVLSVVRGRTDNRVEVLQVRKSGGHWRAFYRRSIGDPGPVGALDRDPLPA